MYNSSHNYVDNHNKCYEIVDNNADKDSEDDYGYSNGEGELQVTTNPPLSSARRMDLRDSPVLMFTASTPTPTPTDESDAPASPPVRPDVAREAARATAGLDLPSPVAPKKPRYTAVPTQFQHQFTPVLNQYRQQFTPAPKPFQAQLPASDSSYMWPPGVHALAGLDELLICPSKGERRSGSPLQGGVGAASLFSLPYLT